MPRRVDVAEIAAAPLGLAALGRDPNMRTTAIHMLPSDLSGQGANLPLPNGHAMLKGPRKGYAGGDASRNLVSRAWHRVAPLGDDLT